MLYAFNYRAFGYDTSDHTKWNARDVFNMFTSFDHSIFGHTKFWVRDTNLFKPKNDSSHIIVTRTSNATSQSTARASVYTLQTCGTVTVCSNPGPAPEPAPSPKPALARLTDDCSTVEICTTFYYGGGSDGTGSTGGWTGTGDGTDGGGSGGTGWYGEPTSSVTCASAAVQRNSFIEPTGLCPSGWVPVSDNISMHLAIILNLNSTQTNWLLQNSAVAQEIEKALQESLSDENALTGLAYMDVYPDYAVAASRITIDAAMNSLINGPYDSWHFDLIKQNIPGWQNSSITDPVFWAMFNIQCTLIKIEHPEYNRWRVYWEAMGEVVHLGLDLAGLIPVIGEIADLTNGVIYTIEGNGVDAALSYASAIPVAGWFSASVKFAKKGIALADGTKTTFKWIKRTDNLINFGDRGQLRKVLGLAKGDLRIAHHIIPWGHGVDDVVQEAAKGNNAFHLNELLNGIPLTSIQHSGSHSLYSARVKAHLTSIKNNLVSSGNFNPTSAREAIQDLINNVIKPAIASQPNTPINQIVF
jgi:hypothetical protein